MTARSRPLLAVLSLVPLAAVCVGIGTVIPSPSFTGSPTTVTRGQAAAEAAPVRTVCPGPLQIPRTQGSSDSALGVTAPSATASVSAAAIEPDSALLYGRVTAPGTARRADGSVLAPTLSLHEGISGRSGSGAGRVHSSELGASVLDGAALSERGVAVAAAAQGLARADAVQSTTTPGGDYRSSALTRCVAPGADALLLGGSTITGAGSLVTLTNPGTRPATATVQAWGMDGPLDLGARRGVVVAPGASETVLLESLVPGQRELAVRVQSTGAPLAASLQVTRRSGLTPGGAEILSPQADAQVDAVIPGVRASAGMTPVALLLNPRGTDAHAEITVHTVSGEVKGAAHHDVVVPAGRLVAVPLTGMPAGDAAVRVRSDEPVASAVRSSVAGADLPGDTLGVPVDVDTAAPAPDLSGGTVLALPAGASGVLALAATAPAAATVIPLGANGAAGAPQQVRVAAGQQIAVPSARLALGGKAPSALVIVPDQPGRLHGAWVQATAVTAAPGSSAQAGPLLSTVTVPTADSGEGAPRVSAG